MHGQIAFTPALRSKAGFTSVTDPTKPSRGAKRRPSITFQNQSSTAESFSEELSNRQEKTCPPHAAPNDDTWEGKNRDKSESWKWKIDGGQKRVDLCTILKGVAAKPGDDGKDTGGAHASVFVSGGGVEAMLGRDEMVHASGWSGSGGLSNNW
ncbi:hypothetical protein BDV93DRAFT_510180 [Ceratobasidium sp. AG-I]|nr:hypothetical protein BDV93DRAFT_510180 [Ceratobasidium sp. AG-I]